MEASAEMFDPFTVDNADFDAVPVPPQQLQNKESFGSFHEGDFFESTHVSRSSGSTSSHVNSRHNSDESGTNDDGSRSFHSHGTRSRSSNMTGDSFGSQTSISSSLQHSGGELHQGEDDVRSDNTLSSDHPNGSVSREASFASVPFSTEVTSQTKREVNCPFLHMMVRYTLVLVMTTIAEECNKRTEALLM